jgi:hypothetical protein
MIMAQNWNDTEVTDISFHFTKEIKHVWNFSSNKRFISYGITEYVTSTYVHSNYDNEIVLLYSYPVRRQVRIPPCEIVEGEEKGTRCVEVKLNHPVTDGT